MSQSKILIEPENGGLFPQNYHLALTEKLIGVYRIFTEESQE